MKPLVRLLVVVASVALMPALIFAGPAAAAKGGNKGRVDLCKQSILNGAAFRNLGQCVSRGGPNPGVGGGGPGLNIHPQALLLGDGTVVLTVDYRCLPGAGGNTTGTLTTSVLQPPNESRSTQVPATCDGGLHTTSTDNGPGVFVKGPADGGATVLNSDQEGAVEGAPITIS